MKYLIKDTELMAYLEGGLSKEEVRSLKRKMEENGELNMLYHLKLSYEEGMKEYADALIGEDDFAVDDDKKESQGYFDDFKCAAKIVSPKKDD